MPLPHCSHSRTRTAGTLFPSQPPALVCPCAPPSSPRLRSIPPSTRTLSVSPCLPVLFLFLFKGLFLFLFLFLSLRLRVPAPTR